MIEAKALWTDNDRFIGQANSEHALVVEAGKENTASTPMELVLIGLCACTASDVVGILRRSANRLQALKSKPWQNVRTLFPRFTQRFALIFRVGGPVTQKAMEDAVHLSKEKYCSVSAMIEHTARIDFEIEYLG